MSYRTVWTPEKDEQLKASWGNTLLLTISATMGLSESHLRHRANQLGLPRKALKRHYEPPKEAWINAVSIEARQVGLRPRDVLAGSRNLHAAQCRQRAFHVVLEQFPECSIAGLGRVAGYGHDVILHGLRRTNGATVDEARDSRASGRMPMRRGMNAIAVNPVPDKDWHHDPRVIPRDWILLAEAGE